MNRLRELREEKDFKMNKIASELGMPYTTYVGYEKGTRKLNDQVLKQFASYYGVTTDYILGVTDEKNPATESDGTKQEPVIDELESYARSLFQQLNLEGKIEAINQLKSLRQTQAIRDGQTESD